MSVRLDLRDFEAGMLALKGKFPKAVRRAIKKTATSARAEMGGLILKDTGLPARKAKDAITIKQPSDFTAVLFASPKRIPLIEFKARGPEPSRGRGRGVTYALPGGRGRAPKAFITTIGGRRGVFERKDLAPREPTRELHGPSIVNVFKKFLKQAETRATETLVKNLRHEIDFAAKKR